MTTFKKLFIDSRHRATGTHADFSVILSNDQRCSRTTSAFVSSLSLSNTFQTIEEGVNDKLYLKSSQTTPAPGITEYTENFYVMTQRDRFMPAITASNNTLYFMLASTAGVGNPYILYGVPVDPGTYTMEQLADKLQLALRSHIATATVTFNEATGGYDFSFNAPGSATLWWVPNADDLDAGVTRFSPDLWTGTTIQPGDHSDTVNAMLKMPRLESGLPFRNAISSDPLAYTQPTVCQRFVLTRIPTPTIEQVRSALQGILVAIFGAGATVTASGRQLTFNTGADKFKLRLPTGDELASAAWKAANWTGPDYTSPNSYNKQLQLPPSSMARTVTTGKLPSYTGYHILPLLSTHYADGALLAADLQLYIRAVVPDVTVSFDLARGTLLFSADDPWRLQFPTERELRDVNWRFANWHGEPYSIDEPTALNGQLYFPSPSAPRMDTLTAQVDLIPYREIYLASSLGTNRTLQSGPTGATDVIARIPIDAPYGSLIQYRSYGTPEALSVSDQSFRQISFTLRDYKGRVMPVDQPVVIELCFFSSDPMEM